jgi:hypothetical protein
MSTAGSEADSAPARTAVMADLPPGRPWPHCDRHKDPNGRPGRGGHAGLFVCSADPAHPPSFFTQ